MSNSWDTKHWANYEAYIKSGGQDPIIREVCLIDHSTALVKRIQELEAKRECQCQVESGEGAWNEAHEYPCPKADNYYAISLEYYQRAMG